MRTIEISTFISYSSEKHPDFDVYPLYWIKPVEGAFLCATAMNSKEFERIREWVRIEDACGPEALHHKNQNKDWTAEERYALVAQAIAGHSCTSVAIDVGINKGLLYQWVCKYKELGYYGLVNMKIGADFSSKVP